MKKLLLILFLFMLLGFSWAQESSLTQEGEDENSDFFNSEEINDDLNTDFNDDFSEDFSDVEEESDNTIIKSMSRSRLTLHAEYNFMAGYSPGWAELPWDNNENRSYVLGAKMEALLSLDFQLSENLRVWNSFYFFIPSYSSSMFSLKEFYFDYNYNGAFFLRGGQYEIAWGISPFYPFTNLPIRVPREDDGGDSYIIKLDIPIGLGGIQILGMTRYSFMEDPASPKFNEIAFGAKYNLALQAVDIDLGMFYYQEMPLRFFTSVKTTLGKTEMYVEGLAASSHKTMGDFRFSGNVGLVRDFFDGKLTLAGEVYYNGEADSYWYRAKEDIRDADTNPFYNGWNGAFSFIIRPGVLGMRLFSRLLYSYTYDSYQVIPGISFKPFNQITATLTVPMALGSKDENTYYGHNADVATPPRPFSLILGITINGAFRYRIYMDRSSE